MNEILLIASHNQAKINEIKKYLDDTSYQIKNLASLQLTGDVEETGNTFEENSLIKARSWAEKTGYLTIADDGGLEIDALNGAPGVHSRRWPGYEASDEELIALVLKKLEGVPHEKRTARLVLVLTLYDPRRGERRSSATINKVESFHQVHESIEGLITETPGPYTPGFPYRALLCIQQFKKLYGELTEQEHEQVNHRKRAVEKIKKLLTDM